MEKKIITGIIIGRKDDLLLNFSYIDFLTHNSVIKIKIPQLFTNYKYKHLLEVNRVNKIEIIKTSKNWILTQIIISEEFFSFNTYKDCLDFTTIIKNLSLTLKENEQTEALKILFSCINNINKSFDFQKFKKHFDNYQGYPLT